MAERVYFKRVTRSRHWNRKIRRYPERRHPLTCPSCDNQDPAEMWIYSTSLDTVRFFGRSKKGDEVALFDEGSWQGSDVSDIPDACACLLCDETWEPRPYQYEIS